MTRAHLVVASVLIVGLSFAAWRTFAADSPGIPATQPATQPARQVQIDLDKASDVNLPEIKKDLQPVPFRTADQRGGWALRIPGNRPIATPAFADGMLFVGGGYGSHEFYAFNAATGEVVWQIKTADDGPTAAVVESGYVAFNTESCTVIIVEAKTGKLVWQEWLGDPLMSQPAISKGKLYIAYPGGSPHGVQRGGDAAATTQPAAANNAAQVANAPANASVQGLTAGANQQQLAAPPRAAAGAGKTAGPAKGNGHRLLCADLRTGEHLWEQDISGDIISAPVIEGDQVFFTCFDGTSFCVNADTGQINWQKKNSGTSAPLLADGHLVVTQKQVNAATKDVTEGIRRLDAAKGEGKDQELLAAGKAEYLKAGSGGNIVGMSAATQATLDSSVGFGGGAPPMAQMAKANDNVGVSSVAGGWAYQGSRAAYANGRLMNAQANFLNSVSSQSGQQAWRAEAQGKGIDGKSQVFSPPAVGKDNIYLCTSQGHLLAVDQKEGAPRFLYAFKQPTVFQPALAQGNMYVGTANGMLICLKTGMADADGWHAWGGNAQHNKKQ